VRPMLWPTSLLLAAGVAAAAGACAHAPRSEDRTIVEMRTPEQRVAVARLSPASGSSVSGTVTFTERADGVDVRVSLRGLVPGEHGFHIHEQGDCSAPDASSAGDHFNPEHAAHADRAAAERHLGDLGNLRADVLGLVETSFVDGRLSLSGEHSILGRAVIVHAQPDDLKTQPGGNAGARVACGIIELQP
jgi:superoxide dismutase, Cu-Zn family